MFDSKTLKISIEEIKQALGMLRTVPNHLKTKGMCKHAVKKLLFLIKYVINTQRMCDKVIIENV